MKNKECRIEWKVSYSEKLHPPLGEGQGGGLIRNLHLIDEPLHHFQCGVALHLSLSGEHHAVL